MKVLSLWSYCVYSWGSCFTEDEEGLPLPPWTIGPPAAKGETDYSFIPSFQWWESHLGCSGSLQSSANVIKMLSLQEELGSQPMRQQYGGSSYCCRHWGPVCKRQTEHILSWFVFICICWFVGTECAKCSYGPQHRLHKKSNLVIEMKPEWTAIWWNTSSIVLSTLGRAGGRRKFGFWQARA